MTGLPEGIGLLRLDHVAIAVADPAEGVALYSDVLGGRFLFGGDSDEQGIRVLQFALPDGSKIELISPLRPDAGVARFLERRGPGVHHLTLVFADVEVALARLAEQGYETVDVDLRRPVWREAYVRPRSGCGVLLQVVDSTLRWDVPADPAITVERVLAGEVVFTSDERAVLRG